jgi:glutathione S-transferase
MGDKFTLPDAYLYVMSRWATGLGMDLSKWPNLKAFAERVAARPKVQQALKEEGFQ